MKLFSRRNEYIAIKFVVACVLIFMLQIFVDGFTELFVLDQSKVLTEPWRLVTAIFLHGSGAHILLNMFVLALFGSMLENIIGTKKFLGVYFGAGIFASIVAALFYPLSLGASGAIMGILGCLTFLRPNMVIFLWFIPMKMWVACIVWVIIDLSRIFDPVSNIAAFAHLGGIFIGLIVGYFLKKRYGEGKQSYMEEVEFLSKQYKG